MGRGQKPGVRGAKSRPRSGGRRPF
jgi:hypothetical protein